MMAVNTLRRTNKVIQYSFVPNHTATMEALARSKLSGREFRVVLFIMRQTNGYLREEDQISPPFFERKTGISRTNVPHVLARLQKLRIVSITPGKPPTYSVNPPQRWKSEVFVKIDEPDSSYLTKGLVNNDDKQLSPKDNLKTTKYRDLSLYNINKDDPDKYSRGRFGHMVARTPEDFERIKGRR